MGVRIDSKKEKKYLVITTTGSYSRSENPSKIIDFISNAALDPDTHYLLLDFRKTKIQGGILSTFQFAEKIVAKGYLNKTKVCAVYNEIGQNEIFLEETLRNRGFPYRCFTSIEEAKKWLFSKGQK